MDVVCVLVAIEPRVYREALAGALRSHRPDLSVEAVEPGDLDREVLRLDPQLVVCMGTPSETVRTHCPAWIALSSAGDNAATVSAGHRWEAIEPLELGDVLAILDRVALSSPG